MNGKQDDSQRHVVVVGGGLAGTAAATILAEQGVHVTVLERENFLGGRAGAWTDTLQDGSAFEMERGFHAFFRNYKNLRSLLRRIDPKLRFLTRLHDYPLLGPNGQSESFARLPKIPPFNIIELVRRSPSIHFRDLMKADMDRTNAMLAFDPERTYQERDEETAKEFLDGLNFPPKARQMLFDVFAHSFFNPEERYSAAELLAMFHFYFTRNPEGLVFDVMNQPFSVAFWKPMESYLRDRGVDIYLNSVAEVIEVQGNRYAVRFRHGDESNVLEADAVVLAVTAPGLKALVAASPSLSPLKRSVDSLETTLPFAVWRLWLDRFCHPHRPPFAGTTGVGLLENISLYEKIESESKRWSAANHGSIVELHAYGIPESLTEEEIKRDLLAGMHAVYPETCGATIREERFLRRQDCPAFAPGSHAHRPGVITPLPTVVLAGDFVKLPFPSALMERATSSGFIAANALLARWKLPETRVEHGPTHGIFASRKR